VCGGSAASRVSRELRRCGGLVLVVPEELSH
jgi:hypothetical protein